MGSFSRIGMVVAGIAWAAGCGSISATSPDGGTGQAGTTGNAGTTGAAGTSGSAGAAGSAGTTGTAGATGAAGTTGGGGTTGAGGTGTTLVACPEKLPNDQGVCVREGLVCEYGDDPRGDRCRTQAVCSSLRWRLMKPDSNSCPSINYGACGQQPGTTCTSPGTYCVQPDGVDCQCTTCPPNMPVCNVNATPVLACVASNMPNCPHPEPNVGTVCNAPDGTECAYCPDISRICSGRVWVPGNQCIRPL